MFRLILFTFAFLPLSAQACPHLQGTWSCKTPSTGNDLQPMSITQKEDGQMSTYKIEAPQDTQIVITDGQEHSSPDVRTGAIMRSQANCSDDATILNKVAIDLPQFSFSATGLVTLQLQNPLTLVITADMNLLDGRIPKHSIETSTCTKN